VRRANNCTIAAGTSGKRLGSTTVGCDGQAILTIDGMSTGWISSMLTTSWGDWVSWISPSMVVLDAEIVSFRGVISWSGGVTAPTGPLLCWRLSASG
jgi:hypothetical protein